MLTKIVQHEELATWHEMIQHAKDERWARMCTGMRQSPYICTQGLHRAEEVAKVLHSDKSNPFNWKQVVLNLPGNKDYDPKIP